MALVQIQEPPAKGVRINEETGELSASGELSVSVEKCETPKDPQSQDVLIKQLHDLGIYSYLEQKNDRSPLVPKEALAKVLCLFIQICEDGGTVDAVNLKGLAALTSDTVIHIINKTLKDKPADEARSEVVLFFQSEDTSTTSENGCCSGWLLLKSLALLTNAGPDLLSSLNLELPTVLVKCLYLLVCLPPSKENIVFEQSFQETLTQVVLHLCRLPVNVEKMVETEALQCLIIGLTSLWDQTSTLWRHKASQILKTISASATENVIPCLLGKHCVRICIQNLLHIRTDVSGPLLAEVAVAVFSFIKDTYDLNPALFEVFNSSNGYKVLENILICCEDGVSDDQFSPVEELIQLIETFIMFGKTELKVALCVSNPQPPGFKFDFPQATGSLVKNLPAFRLLQGSLLRSQDSRLCCQILQTMQRMWEKDMSNFFLLEWSTQTMTQLATCLLSKPSAVHHLFFSMLEMIIFKLNFIPHETLRALLTALKQTWTGATLPKMSELEFGVSAVKGFHRITVHSGLLTEVLCDYGLLKLLLGELRRRAKILIKSVAVTTESSRLSHINDNERLLTNYILQVVSTFTLRSIKNIVRELGMIPYIKIFVNEDQYRMCTLSILEQLAEINPEEFMSIAIGALCSSTHLEIKLKKDLLQSVLKVLESPNSWDAFRKAGGFTGLLSLVTDMEGAFAVPPQAEAFKSIGHAPLLEILLLALHTIALAVHVHKINAHSFETEGYYERVVEALLQLGCFHNKTSEETFTDMDLRKDCSPLIAEDTQSPGKTFEEFVCFAESSLTSKLPKSQQFIIPDTLRTCIILMSYLSKFSTGTFSSLELNLDINCDHQKTNYPSVLDEAEDIHGQSRKAAPSASIVSSDSHHRFSCENVILHPGAIRAMMSLFPLVFTFEDPQLSMDVQHSLVHHIQVMVKSERNRQIMCEGGLTATLLAHCGKMLMEPKHPLHLPVTRIFEKLSSQSITLKDFRNFLCLGDPLMCLSGKVSENDKPIDNSDGNKLPEFSRKITKRTFSLLNSKCSAGSAIPAHQIVSLVSMTSPRTYRPQRISTTPAFVEFDMSESGYGCLFLPSLATVKGVTADSIPIGGTGGDSRGFPPSSGLTFSCWFQINRFTSACESHPIRFLSVVRHMSRTEQQFICLSVSLSACDGCLVISTEEEALTYLDMMEPEFSSPTSLATSLRFRCSSLLIPGQWHHLVVVLSKEMKKSCLASAYLNGKALGTGKMRYIQPFPGSYVSMEPSAVIDVYAVIGTPPLWKDYAALIWKVGTSYLFEEPLTHDGICLLYSKGTAYLGNFLSVSDFESNPARLVPEERISFGINPAVSTVTTVAQIREDYNEVDCRLIAKEMGITSRDNLTPVFLAHNISQHLSGTARTIGAALVGHFGVRTFTPRGAAYGFLCAGGPAVVLSLIAMAPDDSSLYAAVKVLLSVLETNQTMQQEMARIDGFKLLAFLLKSKSSVVSNRTLQLVLCMSDSTEANFSSIHQLNISAFKALISDLDMWQTSDNLDLTVLNHFAEILKSFSDDSRNAEIMRKIDILPKMLFALTSPSMTPRRVEAITSIITLLLKEFFNPLDISRIGLFLVFTLPPQMEAAESHDLLDSHHNTSVEHSGPVSHVYIRNQILCVFVKILNSDDLQEKERQVLFETLGCGWFLLFLQSHLHPSTIKLTLVLLNHFLLSQTLLDSFSEGVSTCSLMKQPSTALDNLRGRSVSQECSSTTCPGFDVLKELLVTHFCLFEVYDFMAALLLRKKLNQETKEHTPLDEFLQLYIKTEQSNPAELCVGAATILLELIKVTIHPSIGAEKTPSASISRSALVSSLLQFLCLLHNLRPKDPLWTLPLFLHTLASVVHPSQVLGDGGEADLQKPVCDFFRILLMDSLLNVSPSSSHPLLILMEFSPNDASAEQSLLFQTELVEFVIDIIYVLSGEEESHTHLNSQDGNSQMLFFTLMENVVLFTKTMVQKLYNGTIMGDCRSLLHFLADQIVMVLENGQAQKDKILSELYSSINRVMLFFLSQSQQKYQDVLIQTLETVLDRWDVVMATYNANVNFMTCFLYCLIITRSKRCPEGFECTSGKMYYRNMSSLIFPVKNRHNNVKSRSNSSISDDQRLESLVDACWSRLMKERQYNLEESFKTDISAGHTPKTHPVLMTEISPLWEEILQKGWKLYTDSLRKMLLSSSPNTFDRISNVVSSVLSKSSKESSTVEEFLVSMELIRRSGQETFERMRMDHTQQKTSEWECLSSKWLDVEAELMRERAVFGPGPGVLLSRDWVQGAAEGPNRTKPHIRRKTQRQSNKMMCLGSERADVETEAKILCEVGAEVEETAADQEQDSVQLTFFPVLNEAALSFEATDPSASHCSCPTDCSSVRIILQELQDGEEVKTKMCIVTVRGLRVTEGVLLFGKDSVYLCEGFTLSSTGEVCCISHHPSRVRNSYVASMLSKDLPVSSCRRWLYQDIKDARFMRYLLEDNALEISMKTGHSAFMVFLNRDHVNAFKKLCMAVPSLKGRGVTEVIANARKTPVIEKSALLKWQRGEMSNFEYLMHLNTLAGRTYNDLMQYPVFPWILADYESETLDLANAASFRDLSKPMGAQTEKRRQMFIQRYKEVDGNEEEGDLFAQCHYCTHYSSAIIVASFLVRMEPFSQTFHTLQGGFDIAERMFHSVKKEWHSASRDNMADVRELIPEFFYLPDFLLNSNHINLGCMEDGTLLGDVELPPWAKGDSKEFIRVHREALESDFVSSRLHLWIDLIFGYKQQGPAAEESLNLFHPYFYAQRDRADSKDPLIKNLKLGYVSNFGQVPKQLFTRPHPARISTKKEAAALSLPTPFFFRLDKLKTTEQPFKELSRGPVWQILCDKEVVVLEKNKILLSPALNCCFIWGFPDNSCAFGNYSTGKTFAVFEELCVWGETLCAVCPNPTTVVTAGTSTVVCVWDLALSKDKLGHMKLRQPLYGHIDAVTCLAVSEVHNVLVSGSRDFTCILWDLEKLSYVTQLTEHTSSVSAVAINDLTGDIASCAGSQLYLWTMRGQLLARTEPSCGPQANLLCVSFSQRLEWDARNVIVTGCSDGSVKIWRAELKQAHLAFSSEEVESQALGRTADTNAALVGCSPDVKIWERCLVLSHELNRGHPVSQRRFKKNPAVTALSMSRSHATLLVGDAWGRVFTWTCE